MAAFSLPSPKVSGMVSAIVFSLAVLVYLFWRHDRMLPFERLEIATLRSEVVSRLGASDLSFTASDELRLVMVGMGLRCHQRGAATSLGELARQLTRWGAEDSPPVPDVEHRTDFYKVTPLEAYLVYFGRDERVLEIFRCTR